MEKTVKKVAVTGGAGQIAYSALFRIAAGEMLGENQPIELRILEVPEAAQALNGVVMELEDCAYPLLHGIFPCTDPNEAFDGVDIALLIGAKPRGPGMERKDLLEENSKIFIEQGKALNDKASSDVLVFVVGNPCNTNGLIALKNAPQIDPSRFFSMTRLDQNRGTALLAKRAGVTTEEIKKLAVWGNHSSTQVPDFLHATIQGKPVPEVIEDRNWLENAFIETVQKRGAAVIEARGKSSAASAAHAAISSIRSLLEPTPEGEWFSVGLYAKNNPYGIEEDLLFSFPCRSKGEGKVEIVEGLKWDPFLEKMIRRTEQELIEERNTILG